MVTRAKNGFTLLELSVVLLIIGFLVGGIYVGQNLKDSAQARKLIGMLEDFQTSTVVFKDRYKFLPGDMNATDAAYFFPSSSSFGTYGNENGIIDVGVNLVEPIEYFAFLSLAGLYNGPTSNYLTNFQPLNNVPIFQGTNYVIAPFGVTTGDYNNYIGLGVQSGISSFTFAAGFTPEQALKLDVKMDDGFPNRGLIRARGTTAATPWSAPSCSTTARANACTDVCGANSIDDIYKLNSGSYACAISMKLVIEGY